MKYDDYRRNHVIVPGREEALEAFLNQDYQGLRHKWRHAFNSNSEDALAWSCFDVIRSLPGLDKLTALDEILGDALGGQSALKFFKPETDADQIGIHIGKTYTGVTTKESTEVDVSIESPAALVFFEAKLYTAVGLKKPHDQIARKLRVGLDSVGSDSPETKSRDFFFVFLDVAPVEKMYEKRRKDEALTPSGKGYQGKWRSAWLFRYYKYGHRKSLSPLAKALEGVAHPPVEEVAERMGWLTWADLFKCTLRATLRAKSQELFP